jgi:hypothetical protein
MRPVVLVNGLAVLTLLLAGLDAPYPLTLVVAAATVAAIVGALRRSLFQPGLGNPGAWGIARATLLGAGVVVVADADADVWTLLAVLAAAAFLALTALEARLGWLSQRAARTVANLPGADVDRFYRRAGSALQWLQLLGILLVPLTAVLAAAGAVALAVALVVVVAAAAAAIAARRDHRQVAPRLRAALEAYDAPVMVYLSGPGGTQYQLQVWLAELEQLAAEGTRLVVVVRERALAEAVAGMTTLPVVGAPEISDLDQLQVPCFRVCLYVNNGAKNGHNVRYRDLTHVQLLHGDSDKPSSYNPVTAMFDRIFVAGQAGIDRYGAHGVQIPREKFVIVGRPQVAGIEQSGSRAGGPRTVLYGPTWAGFNQDNSFGSLAWGEEIVRGLLAHGWRVVFRPHPYSLREPREAAHVTAIEAILAADAQSTGREHVFGRKASAELTLVDCFNLSDALVSDVSSVPADYLFSGKPFVITQVDETPLEDFLTEFPLGRAAYVARLREPGSLAGAVDGLDADTLADVREQTRRYYLGDIPRETYARTFRDAVRAEVAQAGPPPEHTAAERAVAGAEDEQLETSGLGE